MENALLFFKNYSLKEKFWLSLYNDIYEVLFYLCDNGFNYCPHFYQMMYFYFPLTYLFLRRRRKNSNETNFKTPLNYILLHFLLFFKKVQNTNTVVFQLKLIISKVYYFILVSFKQRISPVVDLFSLFFKKVHPWLVWKPIFKKTSYFGLFAYIRSKWYK